MLECHAPHVFALSSSPHRQRPPFVQQPLPPRSILKKPSSTPTSPSTSTMSSSVSSPVMSAKADTVAFPAYQPQQWTIVGIARAQPRRSSTVSPPTPGTPSTSLTVTLLYTPTETLYAWPFNLSSPDAKGICYETHSTDKDNGSVRRPPQGTMSTSLRVLADVIRCWMKIRRERSALDKRRGSDASTISAPGTPGSSLDEVVDNDEVMDQIVDTLYLHPLAPLERSIHLLRQVLPEPSLPEPSLPEPTWSSEESNDQQRGRPPLDSSSSQGSDDDRDSHHRSDSSASSRASTVEASPEDALRARKASSPKLPKINTVLPAPVPEAKTAVPQIRLVEATPQEAEYDERDRTLERIIPSPNRKSSFNGREMHTLHEDASEDVDLDATPTYDSGEVTFIKIQRSNDGKSEVPTSPKTSSPLPASPKLGDQLSSPSPSKISFRDPFKGVERSSPKSSVRVETIEYGSPDSLLLANRETSNEKASRRPSFEGLRSMFGGRPKPR